MPATLSAGNAAQRILGGMSLGACVVFDASLQLETGDVGLCGTFAIDARTLLPFGNSFGLQSEVDWRFVYAKIK